MAGRAGWRDDDADADADLDVHVDLDERLDGPLHDRLDDALDDHAETRHGAHAPTGGSAPGARSRGGGGRRARRWAPLAVIAVVVLVLAAGALRRAEVRAQQGPPLDGSATATQLFGVLRADQPTSSSFPEEQAAARLGVLPGSARLLAATPGPVFWAARDGDGGACLVVRGSELPLRFTGACASPAQASRRGVVLPAGAGLTAVLVPDGFDTARLAADGYARLGDGLWVDGGTATALVEDAVGVVDAEPVVPVRSQTGDATLPIFLTEEGRTYALVLSCLDAGQVLVRATVDGDATAEDCSTTPSFRRFTGDGRPVRVDLAPPAGVLWAARVVACEGSLRGPVCDR